jgi:hypothetical protein
MRYGARYLGMALLFALAAALLGWMVMLLWNAVIPAVFVGGRSLDYPHALGLLVLSRVLFGGFHGRGGWHRGRHWRRWDAMTPEEREHYKQSVGSGRWVRRDERA